MLSVLASGYIPLYRMKNAVSITEEFILIIDAFIKDEVEIE
jgi:hypothetical protein